MKKYTYLLLLLFVTINLSAQVGINTDNSDPDASAMLDVKSTNKGMLVPRMTSSQRTIISNAAIGLLVFDIDTESFWFKNSSGWTELVSGGMSTIADADDDTKIQVEESADEDIIRFDVENRESMVLKRVGPVNRTQLSFPDNYWDIFIGEGAGESLAESSNSTAVGYHSFRMNDFGISNAAFGALSLEKNESGSRNTALGTQALRSSKGDRNTGVGNESLFRNTTGNNNVGIGNNVGYGNQQGSNNVLLGNSAGGKTSTHNKSNNVMIGHESGLSTLGSGNLFLGYNAGKEETGSNKLFIENSDSDFPLLYGEFDNDLLRINGTLNINNAFSFPTVAGANGQVLTTNGSGITTWANAPIRNSIANSGGTTKVDASDDISVTFEAGGLEIFTMYRGNLEFRNTSGSIYMGGDAGKADTYSGFGNIGIGLNALSENTTGSGNTAIGANANVRSSNLSNATAIGANARVNQSNALVLGNNAKVGIGTSTPDEKLHVVGNIKIQDGNAQAGYILTSDANGVGTWQQNLGAISSTPIGVIEMWITDTPPAGWLICDGSTFNTITYPELSALLNSDKVPNLQRRFPLGAQEIVSQGETLRPLKSTGGEEEVTLNINQIPAHTHGIAYREGSGNSGNDNKYPDLENAGKTANTESMGGGQPHNNMPPYYAVHFIIKAK